VASTQPLAMELAREAGVAQLDALHAQVNQWHRTMKPEEWKTLRVVNIGSQMPRASNVVTQYFARLFNEKGEGRRIIYAESLWDEAKALNLLATHQLDSQIGTAFFNDDTRMNRDLLSDIATEYLKLMKFDEQPTHPRILVYRCLLRIMLVFCMRQVTSPPTSESISRDSARNGSPLRQWSNHSHESS